MKVAGKASVGQICGGFGAPVAEGVVAAGAATTLLKSKGGTVRTLATAVPKDHRTPAGGNLYFMPY